MTSVTNMALKLKQRKSSYLINNVQFLCPCFNVEIYHLLSFDKADNPRRFYQHTKKYKILLRSEIHKYQQFIISDLQLAFMFNYCRYRARVDKFNILTEIPQNNKCYC